MIIYLKNIQSIFSSISLTVCNMIMFVSNLSFYRVSYPIMSSQR